jgi:hypothetical protein
MAKILRGSLRGAKIGLLAGLCLALLYPVILVLGDIELNKTIGYTLLFLGFPLIFAVEPFLRSLGLQGGKAEAVTLVSLSLPLNGALWWAVVGSVIALLSWGRRRWIRPQTGS